MKRSILLLDTSSEMISPMLSPVNLISNKPLVQDNKRDLLNSSIILCQHEGGWVSWMSAAPATVVNECKIGKSHGCCMPVPVKFKIQNSIPRKEKKNKEKRKLDVLEKNTLRMGEKEEKSSSFLAESGVQTEVWSSRVARQGPSALYSESPSPSLPLIHK